VSECADLNPLCSASASAVRDLDAIGMSKVHHTPCIFPYSQHRPSTGVAAMVCTVLPLLRTLYRCRCCGCCGCCDC
jgi:hypothetical protein